MLKYTALAQGNSHRVPGGFAEVLLVRVCGNLCELVKGTVMVH